MVNSASSSNEGGGNVMKMLIIFGNNQNRSSLYENCEPKKTSPNCERAKLKGGLYKQTSDPIGKCDTRKSTESLTTPQWLKDLKLKKDITTNQR